MIKQLKYCLLVAAASLTACHSDILSDIDDLKSRVTDLETLCGAMNANIDAAQTLISAKANGDLIESVSDFTLDDATTGYVVTFSSGRTVTIYNGANGIKGQDGVSPSISAAKYSDGLYYWTLNGEWLLNADGGMLPVTGAKGDQGKQGEAGTDAADGVTPRLKIENGDWYVSYNGAGTDWSRLGTATGKDGKNGTDGTDGTKGEQGEQGDSMFSKVEQDDDYAYFTLSGSGAVIKIAKSKTIAFYTIAYKRNPKNNSSYKDSTVYTQVFAGKDLTVAGYSTVWTTWTEKNFFAWNTKADGTGTPVLPGDTIRPTGDLTLYAQYAGLFEVSANTLVFFSPGNLQYRASDKAWRFAPEQYDYIAGKTSEWTDMFGYGTGDNPDNTSIDPYDYTLFTDWGVNTISGYPSGTWRTLTSAEWDYLFTTRGNSYYGYATVNGVKGIALKPTDQYGPYSTPSTKFKTADQVSVASYSDNVLTSAQWSTIEKDGFVFLPAAGYHEIEQDDDWYYAGRYGFYRSRTGIDTESPSLTFSADDKVLEPKKLLDKYSGFSVRLVRNQ